MGYLRKSKLEDFKFVVENMREMDRLETYYQTDMTPEDALSVTFLGSQINMTIASDDDEPIGLCGVFKDGCIWCIATDELFDNKKYRIQLVRKGKEWVNELLQTYDYLYNYVYAENKISIKWLRSMNFNFINLHKDYGLHKKPFYEFMRIA